MSRLAKAHNSNPAMDRSPCTQRTHGIDQQDRPNIYRIDRSLLFQNCPVDEGKDGTKMVEKDVEQGTL
jgi:hypothetical protein